MLDKGHLFQAGSYDQDLKGLRQCIGNGVKVGRLFYRIRYPGMHFGGVWIRMPGMYPDGFVRGRTRAERDDMGFCMVEPYDDVIE